MKKFILCALLVFIGCDSRPEPKWVIGKVGMSFPEFCAISTAHEWGPRFIAPDSTLKILVYETRDAHDLTLFFINDTMRHCYLGEITD